MEDALAPPPVPPPPAHLAAAVLTRRRSHLDSASYRTLSRLFSHCLHLHPSRCDAPPPPEAEPAATVNPTFGDAGEPRLPTTDDDCYPRKDVEKEAAAAGSPSRQETVSPARNQPAAANPTGDPGEIEAPHCLLEDAEDVVVVQSTCHETGAGGAESRVRAGLVVDDEAFKSVKACLEGEVDESVEGAVGNDDGQLLLDAMMTNFTGLIDDVGAGTIPVQSCAVFGGELQSTKTYEESKQLGGGIEDREPVISSDCGQIDGGGFEEGEIEGELQDLDSEESGDSELGDEDAEDEKLEGNSVCRGSGEKEPCDHETQCGNLHLTPEIKGNGHLIVKKDANVGGDTQISVTRAQAVSYDEVVDWNETPLPDGEDSKPGKKRKRHLTEKRKAQKTKNKRQKRAQQRRAEGVNKVHPRPLKPKEVPRCNFYNHGKCQQGNSCKFSHDFTPSTKYKACSHFARGSCLKGDDCPFDHELSKYLCHNYKKGTCLRGDKCKFSHVMPTTEGTPTPDAKNPDALLAFEKTNLREQTSSQTTSTVHNGEPVASAPTKQQSSIFKNLAGISINFQEVSARIPRGVQFFPFGKGGPNSSSPHQGALSTEKHRNANGSQHQAEGQKIVMQNGQKRVPLLNEKNSSKEAISHPCSDPKKDSSPTDLTPTPGSIHTQHEVSEASRILQEFLFGAGS